MKHGVKKETLLFLLEVLAISSFFTRTIPRHRLDSVLSPALIFFLFFLLLSACLGAVMYPVLKFYARRLPLHLSIVSLSPFLLLPLVFIQEFIFLKDISQSLLVVSILGFLYLQFHFLSHSKTKAAPISSKLSRTKTAFLCFALSGIVYSLAASSVLFTPYPITGDEPHYLLITKSLLSDGDINLWNNFENKDYLEFYPGRFDSHTKTGKRGARHQYSRHMPGFSALILPAYALGAKIGKTREARILAVRLFLSLLAAAMSGMFFLFCETLLKKRVVSLIVWAVFSFSTPVLFFSYQIYPELAASLISISVVFVALLESKHKPFNLVLAGIGVGILPWLGLKYLAISFGCGLLFLISFLRQKQKIGKYIYFSLPIFVSAVFFLVYLWFLYGKLSLIEVYRGTTVEGVVTFNAFFHRDPVEFARCWVGYLFDQRVGLFAYSPIFMLFLPGVILWFRNRRKEVMALLIPLLLYWALCSLSHYWGGYSPPGRTLLPVLWIFGVFMGAALALSGRKKSRIAVHFLTGFTFLNAFLLARDTRLLFHENLSFPWAEPGKVSNVLDSLSNAFIDFTQFVPSLSSQEGVTFVPLFGWLMVFILIGFAFIRGKRKSEEGSADLGKTAPLFLVFGVGIFVACLSFLDIHLDGDNSFQIGDRHVYFQDGNTFGPELDGFWTKGGKEAAIIVKSPQKAKALDLILVQSAAGKTTVQAGNDIKVIENQYGSMAEAELVFPDPVGFAWKGEYFYSIKIRTKRGFVPSKRDAASRDNRYLGAFVRLGVH
jgi:hypothetical protein